MPRRPRDLHATLFARIPERLDDEQRRRKYDEPLAAIVRDGGVGTLRFGVSQRNDAGEVEWVGVELELIIPQGVGLVAQHLADLGAPSDTLLEVEMDTATVQLTLAEATGK